MPEVPRGEVPKQERWPDLGLPEKDEALAERAVKDNWGESYSSPQDQGEALPAGTIDLVGGGDQDYWVRIWCSDGTARNVPADVFPQVEEENKKRRGE